MFSINFINFNIYSTDIKRAVNNDYEKNELFLANIFSKMNIPALFNLNDYLAITVKHLFD